MSTSTTKPDPALEAANARIADLEAKAAAADAAAEEAEAAKARVAELEDQITLLEVNAAEAAAPVVYANEPPSTIGDGYPVGVFIGKDVASTHIDGVEYAVGDDGCISGKAKRK